MQNRLYSTGDLIQDEAFQQWVFFPNDLNCRHWDAFLEQHPAQRKNVEEAREFLLAIRIDIDVPENLMDRIRSDFNTAIDRYEASKSGALHPVVKAGNLSRETTIFRRFLYPVAASLLLLAAVGGYVVTQSDIPGNMLHALTFETQKTPQGKQRQVVLPDGTYVWLNANSELSYPREFSDKEVREVYLEGEAFFDVAENKKRPFVVHASGVYIKVLGTSFNVRSYASDPVVETTLVKGVVSIASSADDSAHQVTLMPNQQALFSKDSKAIALEDVVNTENFIGWKSGWMIFDDKPFSYIRETLERWYNVRIIMEDEHSLSCTFSAKFKDKTLQEVLEIFKNTESINYRIDGDRVFIDGRLCHYENVN